MVSALSTSIDLKSLCIVTYMYDRRNFVDSLGKEGWAILSWEASRSLEGLAERLFLHNSESCVYRIGRSTTLTATTTCCAKPGTKSSLRGLGAFPPHTDEASRPIPPRYILMRSLSGQTESATFFLRFRPNQIGKRLISDLAGGLWAYRGSRVPHISPVWVTDRIKWDEDCMRPLDRIAKRAQRHFRTYVESASTLRYMWSDRSSVIVIDNWNTLHGRDPVPARGHRILERLYVEIM